MKPWRRGFCLHPSLTMFFLLFCFPRMTLNISYLSHTEQLSLDTFEYIDCGNNSTIPHPMGWWWRPHEKKTTNTQLEVWRNEYSAAFSAASLLRGVWKCISSYSVCCFSIPEDFNQPLQCFKFKILMLRIQFCVWTDVFFFFLCSYLLEIQL